MHLSVGNFICSIIQLFNGLLMLWCVLSWFPNVKWYEQPFKTLDMIIRPVMAPFRKILPPMGGMDLSPMIAMMMLYFIANAVVGLGI